MVVEGNIRVPMVEGDEWMVRDKVRLSVNREVNLVGGTKGK